MPANTIGQYGGRVNRPFKLHGRLRKTGEELTAKDLSGILPYVVKSLENNRYLILYNASGSESSASELMQKIETLTTDNEALTARVAELQATIAKLTKAARSKPEVVEFKKEVAPEPEPVTAALKVGDKVKHTSGAMGEISRLHTSEGVDYAIVTSELGIIKYPVNELTINED